MYTWTDIDFFRWDFFKVVEIRFESGLRSLQYKAERLGWSGSLLLQTEAALIGNYGREQTIDLYFICPHFKKPKLSVQKRWYQQMFNILAKEISDRIIWLFNYWTSMFLQSTNP